MPALLTVSPAGGVPMAEYTAPVGTLSLPASVPLNDALPPTALKLSFTAVGAITTLALAVAQLVGDALSQIW
ncbi:hypothetical protein D3C87_574520 [compost metagenome]